MKVLYLIFLLCILGIYAQRRSGKSDAADLEPSSQRPISRSRGRTRFSVTPEFEQVSAEYEAVTKNTRKTDVPRRKIEDVKAAEKRIPRPTKESGPKSRPYEVKELVDDVPREDSRRLNKKPRVVTETRFEAANAPKTDLFTPASPAPEELPPNLSSLATPAVPESIAEETALPAQLTTLPVNGIVSTEKSTEDSSKSSESLDLSNVSEIAKSETELKRKRPAPPVSSTKPSEPRRAPQGRARVRGTTGHRVEEPTTPGSKRVRTKASRTEEPSSAVLSAPNSRSNFRPARRRTEAVAESVQEPVKTRVPSVFAAENAQELPSRSRTGRKVSSASELRNEQRTGSDVTRTTARSRSGRISSTISTSSTSSTPTQTTTNAPEKVNLNLNRRADIRRGSRITEPATEKSVTNRSTTTRVTTAKETEKRSQRRGASRSTTTRNLESTTQHIERQARGRARSRSFLTLNEQKLEVLPLFENEPKIVLQNYDSITPAPKSSLGRRRSLNAAEDIATASTKQSELQLDVDPLNEEPSSSTPSNIRVSRQQSISVETKTEKAIRKVYKKRPIYQRSKTTRKPHAALSEPQEVTEVTIRKFRPLNSRKNNVEDSSNEEVPAKDEKETIDKTEKSSEKSDSKKIIKVNPPKVSFRQVVRKVSQKLPSTKAKEEVAEDITKSEEAIEEADNYPAPFKAAIQAKKIKKEGLGSRPTKSNELSVTKTAEEDVTSSIASSTLKSSVPSAAPVAENVVNKNEEINHKSETESTTSTPSTKFPRPRFSLTSKKPKSTENSSEPPSKSASGRPVLPPRKYKPGKPKPVVTTTTQSPTEVTEDSETTSSEIASAETGSSETAPSEITVSPLQKFHARFKSSRSQNNIRVTQRPAHKSRSYSPKAPKGLYSSKKLSRSSTIAPDAAEETEKPKLPIFNVETSALSTKVPPVGQGIKKSSRFSSRYRSDILSRSGAHRTSTSGPTYVPTVPTVTPPPTSVKFEVNELGMEIISLDDTAANTVPSANLISGDYLSSSPSTKTDPTVESKGATTEKPVSIIERIINSITSISTTSSPDSSTKTSTTTSGQPTKNSAILNLVSKRPKDKTVTIELPLESGAQKLTNSPNSVDYRTTEKPTTIIEKILSSLSAIRADTVQETTTVDPLQVGSNYNTVDTTLKLSPTESTSSIAKPTVPMSKGTGASALPLISDSTTVFPTSTASSSSTSGGITLDSDTSSTLNDISTIPIGTSSITPRSIPTTTPLSQTTSTTLDPSNTFDEIISDQTLPQRTIDKLLSLLNIVSPSTTTPEPATTKLVLVTPKLTTFVTSNTEPINTEQTATPVPTTLPTILDSSTTIVSSTSETTTPTLFTSTLNTPSEVSSDDINLIANPLSSAEVAEPTVSSRILDMISTISRIMGSTLNPTTLSPTSPLTSESGPTTNLAITTSVGTVTPAVSTTVTSTETSVVTATSAGVTTRAATTPVATGTSIASTTLTTSGTTIGITTSTAIGTPSTVTIPTATGTPEAVTTPATYPYPLGVTTPIVTESGLTSTTPLAVTDPLTSTIATQTISPSSTPATSDFSTVTASTISSSVTNPSTIIASTTGTPTTISSPTTIQGTTSTQVSVVQGSISTADATNPTSTTVASNTQTASTLSTTVNTTPAFTSTTSNPAIVSTTGSQTEVTSAGTGTTGSSIITSTTKFTRETTTDSTLEVPTTLPTLAKFEVSPDRVSVYSANDISSTFVPDDSVSTTVSISARAFVPGTTLSTIAEGTASNTVSTTQNIMPTTQPTVATTGVSSTVVATTQNNVGSTSTATSTSASPTTNIISSSSMATAVPLANNVISSSTASPTTSVPIMTTINPANNVVDSTTQDVSSNTIDTSSVTDKQSLVNQTDVSNLVNPLSAGTNVSVVESSSMPSPPSSDNSTTTNTRMTMMEFLSRNGRLLQFEPNPLQNNIQSNAPVIREKDYFIFGVLSNNTILRKRPSIHPTKDTPFLIYGVLPNNTLIQKFPNGTIVPMEPVIQVIGFDTRENPPRPPEIISNQVTPDQESRPDNNKVSRGDVAQNTVSSVDANQLSINSDNKITANTLPPLTEILGGRTVKAFNSIVNQTNGDKQAPRVQTLEVDPLIQSRVNVENVELNTISSASSPPPPTSSTTSAPAAPYAPALPSTPPPGPPNTEAPFTTPLPLSSTSPVVTTQAAATTPRMTTGGPPTTLLPSTYPPGPPSTNPTTQAPMPKVTATTGIPLTTFLPTTMIPSTVAPTTIPPAPSTSAPVTTTTSTVPFTSPLSRSASASPNALSLDVDLGDSPNAVSATGVQPTTLMDLLTKGAVATPIPKVPSTALPTTVLSTTISALKDINLKQRQLTEQQKQDLATLEILEKEQNAILQQLAFLTGLNLDAVSPRKGNDNLADRVIAMAMERIKGTGKDSSSTNAPPAFNLLETLSPKDSRQTKSIAAAPSVEQLVKQISANGLNSVTPAGPIVTSTYGKTSDALLASLLKEYGVGPSTPKVLSGAFNKEERSTTAAPKVTTAKPKVTTQAPGRLMQGLNWLLNALAPKPPSKQPQTKPSPKSKSDSNEELLTKQPTEITPVVVESPILDQPGEESETQNVITQEQLVTLIKQLEEMQKDPKKAQNLDVELLKTLQSIESNQKIVKPPSKSSAGIQVITASSKGASSRSFVTTRSPKISTTPASEGVSNNIVEDVGSTPRTKATIPPVNLEDVPGVAEDLEAAITETKIPPVKLTSVPGVPDETPRIRGQLVNYAINVTKAISGFLGSAIQGASSRFVNALSTGSGSLSHVFNASSNSGNILSASSSSG